jgi:hypothetical protein
MAEALGMVHTHGRGLLRGWRWSVGPKLVLDQVAALVPKTGISICYMLTEYHAILM